MKYIWDTRSEESLCSYDHRVKENSEVQLDHCDSTLGFGLTLRMSIEPASFVNGLTKGSGN